MNSFPLSDLLPVRFENLVDIQISGLSIHSQSVKKGDAFIALSGSKSDGRQFIQDAIQNGAMAVICEGAQPALSYQGHIPIVQIPDVRQQIGMIASIFYRHPSRQMKIIGITGTNGKTTTAHLLAEALTLLGMPAASIGTLGLRFNGPIEDFGLTTPDAISLQRSFAMLKQQGAKVVVMEVSSHALDQARVNGIDFTGAIFTNLTQDHLDYHGTMDAYLAAKAKLFQQTGLKFAIINRDDPASSILSSEINSSVKLCRYGLKAEDNLHPHPTYQADCQDLQAFEIDDKGPITFGIRIGSERGLVTTKLIGKFNVYNILAVCGALLNLGFSLAHIAEVLSKISAAPGRMQRFSGQEKPQVLVDYAHTPDALEKALLASRAYTKQTLWCVFGCGGDRDRGKRAQMGKIASQLADKIIITNDNPRTEDPMMIANQIAQGISQGLQDKVQIELDRKEAIAYAIRKAKPEDVILVAGKGHEDYQITGNERRHFSDAECIEAVLNEVKHVAVRNR
ncbi:MAG: UDP-N-acetylmuramoyl-L-alanyl-D-glutamate--2,6-diaminopimelate ligase [Gammaproteobacteria bacterium]